MDAISDTNRQRRANGISPQDDIHVFMDASFSPVLKLKHTQHGPESEVETGLGLAECGTWPGVTGPCFVSLALQTRMEMCCFVVTE